MSTPKDKKADKPLSVFQRRWRKFKTLKRGWYSFVILIFLYTASWLNPLFFNNEALAVSYNGEMHFPIFTSHIEARDLGQRKIGSPDYRALKLQFEEADEGNWVMLPLYPYGPLENLLTDPTLEGMRPPTAPDGNHFLGTDDRGRDVLTRLVYGFRISITFALGMVLLSYLIGMTVGAILGFFGGKIDIFGQRLVEIWAALPFLYTVIIISSIIQPTIKILIPLLAIFSWVGISFYMRGEFLREKSKDYVAAAIAIGEPNRRIMFRHILPNALTPIVSFAPFAIVGGISALVSLDFLGFGLPAPTPSWGELVNQGVGHISDWHLIVFPLLALFMTLLMVVFIGEAIREAFDPKVYSRLR
jgi:microcin C transport system permease protein